MNCAEGNESIEALKAILQAVREAGLRMGALHGLEEFPESHGRDIDLIVHPQDHPACRSAVCEVLSGSGWAVKCHHLHIGIDQLFARRVTGGHSLYLELDLIYGHPFRWRGHEMLDCRVSREDLIEEAAFPVHPWGWFCKNVLIQLLAGNDGKVGRNLADLSDRKHYFPHIRSAAASKRYGEAAELILAFTDDLNENKEVDPDAVRRLRSAVTGAVQNRKKSPQHWPEYGLGMVKAVWRKLLLTFPRDRGAPHIHVAGDDIPRLEGFLETFQREQASRLPFPTIKLMHLKAAQTGVKAWANYWLKERSRSAGLEALITYGASETLPYRADLVVRLDGGKLARNLPGSSSASQEGDAGTALLAEWVGDAFMANLSDIGN